MKNILLSLLLVCGVPGVMCAWDDEGHRLVTQLALKSLPVEFPVFARTGRAVERLAYLSGEPDRWRNSTNLAFRHASAPDHYLNVDDLSLYGLSPATVSPFRYDFVAQLKLAREKDPSRFRPIDPLKNSDHTRELVGFLPWTLNEHFARLESAFSCLKTFEQHGGTGEEISNAQQNVIYWMGIISHFAGDAAQPLHTTRHFNGWIGPNPHGFNTNRSLHTWIDGGFIRRAGIRAEELAPRMRRATLLWSGPAGNDVFQESMRFVIQQFELVPRVYELDRDGRLSPDKGDVTEGREFISAQLARGGQFLGDLWYSAWNKAPMDRYLRDELARRTTSSRGRKQFDASR
jgi:hypothetical protein